MTTDSAFAARRFRSSRGSRRAALAPAVALVALAGLSAVAPARADLWVREKITGKDGKQIAQRTWSIAPDHVRMDEGSTGFLLDAAHERGWTWGEEGGGCEMNSAPGTGASRVAPASKDPLAGMFEKAYQATLAELSEGPIMMRLQLTEERTIAGHAAQRYDFSVGNQPMQRRWIAPSVPNPDVDAIVDRLQSSPLFSKDSGSEEAVIAFLTRGLGYALRVEDLRTGQSIEAVEVRTSALPAAAFTPPAGCPGD